MPKSKRDRTISLTVTKKKGLEFKQNLITEIRESIDSFENLFVISIFNQRNTFLKDLRQQWSDSKFLFGKNKVIALALGRGPESEYKDNLHKVSNSLVGNVGLLFTDRTKEEVVEFFSNFSCPDYARSGNTATEEVVIQAGPLEQFQHTMEPQLRKLGMHTSLKKGIVTLDTDYTVCQKGDLLNPEQARLLKLFDIMQATFKVNLKLYWNKKSCDFEILDDSPEDAMEDDDDDEAEDSESQNEEAQEEIEEDEGPKTKKLKNKNNKKDENNNN